MSEIKVTVDVGAMRQQLGDQMLALIFSFVKRGDELAPGPGTPVEIMMRDPEIHRIVTAYCRKIEIMERITPSAPPYNGEYDGKTAKALLFYLFAETIKCEAKEKQEQWQWVLSVWHAVMPTLKKRLIEEGYMTPE